MKIRNYEKNKILKLGIIFIILIEIIFVAYLINNKIYSYNMISTIVQNKNIVTTIVSKEERKILYNNSILFYDDKKIKYKIIEDHGIIMERNNKEYYEILLEFKFDKNYKTNDNLIITLRKDKKKLIEIFKLIWDGD